MAITALPYGGRRPFTDVELDAQEAEAAAAVTPIVVEAVRTPSPEVDLGDADYEPESPASRDESQHSDGYGYDSVHSSGYAYDSEMQSDSSDSSSDSSDSD